MIILERKKYGNTAVFFVHIATVCEDIPSGVLWYLFLLNWILKQQLLGLSWHQLVAAEACQ
jgi:hypothetical protein